MEIQSWNFDGKSMSCYRYSVKRGCCCCCGRIIELRQYPKQHYWHSNSSEKPHYNDHYSPQRAANWIQCLYLSTAALLNIEHFLTPIFFHHLYPSDSTSSIYDENNDALHNLIYSIIIYYSTTTTADDWTMGIEREEEREKHGRRSDSVELNGRIEEKLHAVLTCNYWKNELRVQFGSSWLPT